MVPRISVNGRPVLRIGGAGGDEIVLGIREIALLKKHIRSSRRPEVVFLFLRVKALPVVIGGGLSGFHLGAVVGQRVLPVDYLHSNLEINLLHLQLRLAVFEHRARLRRLRLSVADGNIESKADSFIRTRIIEQVLEGVV